MFCGTSNQEAVDFQTCENVIRHADTLITLIDTIILPLSSIIYSYNINNNNNNNNILTLSSGIHSIISNLYYYLLLPSSIYNINSNLYHHISLSSSTSTLKAGGAAFRFGSSKYSVNKTLLNGFFLVPS